MRVVESIEDQKNGVITYDLGNNQFIKFDRRAVQEFGVERLLAESGHGDKIPTGRVNVMQHGRLIGTVPATFDPLRIKSKSWLYDPRPGDFKWCGDYWEADRMMGAGDFECIDDFSSH
jgi:hypothetical protein